MIERIIPETDLGRERFYTLLGQTLAAQLDELTALPVEELLEQRYARFRAIGVRSEWGAEDGN